MIKDELTNEELTVMAYGGCIRPGQDCRGCVFTGICTDKESIAQHLAKRLGEANIRIEALRKANIRLAKELEEAKPWDHEVSNDDY